MTVERGIDPRKFALLPYGGAGALHAVELARALDIPTVVIPVAPGNFSAFGLLVAPIRYDESCTYHRHQDDVKLEEIEALFEKLEAAVRKKMEQDHVAEDSVEFQRKIDTRYFGQAYELTIPISNGKMDQAVWDRLVSDFNQVHERSYGFRKENDPLEIVSLRLSVVGKTDRTSLYAEGKRGSGTPERKQVRKAFFAGRWMDTDVYQRDDLLVGDTFTGPAIVEETGATSVIGPGDVAQVDARRNLIVTVADHETCRAAAQAGK